jgi:hypothetical protein
VQPHRNHEVTFRKQRLHHRRRQFRRRMGGPIPTPHEPLDRPADGCVAVIDIARGRLKRQEKDPGIRIVDQMVERRGDLGLAARTVGIQAPVGAGRRRRGGLAGKLQLLDEPRNAFPWR